MIKISKSIKSNQSLVAILFDETDSKQVTKSLPSEFSSIVELYRKEKKLKENSITTIQLKPEPFAPRLILINLGKKGDYQLKRLRSLAGSAVRALPELATAQWVSLEDVDNWEFQVSQVIAMVQYEVPHSKSKHDEKSFPSHRFISTKKTMISDGYAIGLAVNKARSFANMPANILTTTSFVDDIKALFKGDKRYSVSVLDESALRKKKMFALLGVGQGSKYPSYLVDITYDGGGKDHVALVGKGVMFDTGGISIKPSMRMREMKGDMGGAAAVVGAAWSAGQINLKRKVSFIVPIVENMVSKDAQRPGDVVVASNGKSIEITNTDAEGRLILADALVYATKKKVSKIIDIATLTGASIIALGPYATAVLGNNQALVDNLIDAAATYDETLWQLPLFEEYKDLLKSDVADILNANEGREAGTITAAKFLEQFVDETPWAHLDIASTMTSKVNKGDQVKGMTGAGTRALISFLMSKSH